MTEHLAPPSTSGVRAPGPCHATRPEVHIGEPAGSRAARRRRSEAGMATAEYAVVTLAAVGFAGLLLVILKSSEVRGLLMGIIRSALGS